MCIYIYYCSIFYLLTSCSLLQSFTKKFYKMNAYSWYKRIINLVFSLLGDSYFPDFTITSNAKREPFRTTRTTTVWTGNQACDKPPHAKWQIWFWFTFCETEHANIKHCFETAYICFAMSGLMIEWTQ